MGSYSNYLKTTHWQETRSRYYNSDLYRKDGGCMICLRDLPTDLHHKTYKRLGKEKLGDLIGICRECHETIHRNVGNNLWERTSRVKKRMRKWIRRNFWNHGKKCPTQYRLPNFMKTI